MKAIFWDRPSGSLKYGQRPEPEISSSADVKARVLATGVCGTDRELLSRKGFIPPENSNFLITGHEVLARLVETGPDVSGLVSGDFVTFTIRRGCGKCPFCASGRSDMCATGGYSERGLGLADGFNSEFVVDDAANCVKLPAEVERLGVLCEPLSTVEKALSGAEEAARRLPRTGGGPWLHRLRCLVMGAGPMGLLASMALLLRGAQVWCVDIHDEKSMRPEWLRSIGASYIDGRKLKPERVAEAAGGKFALVYQAAGAPQASFEFLSALAPNGVFVFFASGRGAIRADASTITGIIDGNQALLGSVSSGRSHFTMAVDCLAHAELKWPGHAKRLMTGEYAPEDFKKAYAEEPLKNIKTVIHWG
jgi:threonine dehydrogenase-like Zn-dependent dehydrogenase